MDSTTCRDLCEDGKMIILQTKICWHLANMILTMTIIPTL